ncbi:MAG: DUF309 domain-containing protein [Deltaproteobacteria bacterium]|nr:DUF309 domain-containing protein [Deltaproteobacteria bacterium]
MPNHLDQRLAVGIALFNRAQFFAAHEIWEDLWHESVGNDKQFLQGLIQIAAGYLKVESGIRNGALKLLGRGVAIVRQFAPSAMGLALNEFVAAVEADLRRVQGATVSQTNLQIVRPPLLG